MLTPRISVALVTYNHANYIAQALDSIFAQKIDVPWELVVGDDASTDATPSIIADYAARHPGIVRLLPREQNLGMHRNFLQTLQACRGDYVAILEGDDFWTSRTKLRQQQALLDANRGCPACFHPVTVVGDDGHPVGEIFPGIRQPFLSLKELLATNDIPTGSVMFRRALLPALPDSITSLSMTDWPFFIQLARRGDLACIDEVMGCYRRHSGGMWTSQSESARMEKIIALHEWLLHEKLSGNESAGCAALALWEGRLALHLARTGKTGPALRHLACHLRASAHGSILPQGKLIAKTLLAMFSRRLQIFLP